MLQMDGWEFDWLMHQHLMSWGGRSPPVDTAPCPFKLFGQSRDMCPYPLHEKH